MLVTSLSLLATRVHPVTSQLSHLILSRAQGAVHTQAYTTTALDCCHHVCLASGLFPLQLLEAGLKQGLQYRESTRTMGKGHNHGNWEMVQNTPVIPPDGQGRQDVYTPYTPTVSNNGRGLLQEGCWVLPGTPRQSDVWAEGPCTLGLGRLSGPETQTWQMEFDLSSVKSAKAVGWVPTVRLSLAPPDTPLGSPTRHVHFLGRKLGT